ncbi:MAG: hypothetical protein WDA42_04880 [Candidatus Bathyarchaeia archaeon]
MCFKKKYQIPFPEEPVDETVKLEDIDTVKVIRQWYIQYEIQGDWDFWNGIRELAEEAHEVDIDVEQDLPVWNGYQHVLVPAYSISESKLVRFDVNWFNPGTIMHEFCHISYSILKPIQKLAWDDWYYQNRNKGVLKYLFSQHPYGLTNPIEGHAEIGRYLGQYMPEEARKFYPEIYSI